MHTLIQISEARGKLGELVNEAYYTGKPFQLAKGNKPMAMLIGTKEFQEMLQNLPRLGSDRRRRGRRYRRGSDQSISRPAQPAYPEHGADRHASRRC